MQFPTHLKCRMSMPKMSFLRYAKRLTAGFGYDYKNNTKRALTDYWYFTLLIKAPLDVFLYTSRVLFITKGAVVSKGIQ